MMKKLFTTISKKLQKKGLQGLLTATSSKIICLIFEKRTYFLLSRPLDLPLPPYRIRGEIKTYEGTKEDIQLLDYIPVSRRKSYYKNIDKGFKLFISTINGKGVCFIFSTATPHRHHGVGFFVDLQEKEVFNFDGEVPKELRGRAVGVAHYDRYYQEMRKRGYEITTCSCRLTNRNSIRLHLRLGYTAKKQIEWYRILGIPFTLNRPIQKQLLEKIYSSKANSDSE